MNTFTGILLAVLALGLVALAGAHLWQRRALRALRRSGHDLARQLRQQLHAERGRRNELEALLGSMAEGVIAVDPQEKLISLNPAASRLLRIDRGGALGRPLQEAVRNTAIQSLLAETMATGDPHQREFEITLPGGSLDQPQTIEAQTALLHDGDDRRIGALVVLHDVTQLRRLESVRRDFVANVSHEVKTPVAAIKAAVETLLDVHDHAMDPADTERFLRMVARQADRLGAIVEDLLSLARIEQTQGDIHAELQPQDVAPVLAAAAETCAAKAQAGGITLDVDRPASLRALMASNLMEQAVVNLIDNAVKYSPPQTHVRVTAERTGSEVVIAVTDQGRGIEPEHLPRVFGRFYRTDRARSRSLGGTGLGLAIVKHIAEAHGGRVGVQSEVGVGSTFRLYLTAAPPENNSPHDSADVTIRPLP